MLPIRHILVATDFTFCAERACGVALDLAARTGAEVRYVHVDESHQPADAAAAEASWQVPIEHRSGHDPAMAIIASAQGQDADLIVIGTHGRRGFSRLVVGSVTEAVFRHTDRAVLAVPCVPVEGRRVLVPVDFSSESHAALEIGRAFAGFWDAPLDALHVLDVGTLHLPYGAASAEEARDAAISEARGSLERFCGEKDGGPAVFAHVVVGNPADAVVEFARETGARLVVVAGPAAPGAHLGAVTARVMRHARCAVLGVPGRALEPARRADEDREQTHDQSHVAA